jgi:hypothetical protein
VPTDDELERRQLREACLQAMPFPGESALRVSLFQWAREASPSRVLRMLHTIDQQHVRILAIEQALQDQGRYDAEREDAVTLRAELEAEWDNCISLAKAFYRAIKEIPGVWPPAVREVMNRAEAAGIHRFE